MTSPSTLRPHGLKHRARVIARDMTALVLELRRRGYDDEADDITRARDTFVRAAERAAGEGEP